MQNIQYYLYTFLTFIIKFFQLFNQKGKIVIRKKNYLFSLKT